MSEYRTECGRSEDHERHYMPSGKVCIGLKIRQGTTAALEKPWADKAMFSAAPMRGVGEGPQVYLLSMTDDPLGEIASCARMYKGEPTYSLDDITDEERRQGWDDIMNSHLQGPLEAVRFHFFIEGVTRAFTHQMVRQRDAFFAQESMRFAVKEDMADEAAMPPAIKQGGDDVRLVWIQAMGAAEAAYHALVGVGVPAEDARGVLPHDVTTRLHYFTNLRALLKTGGDRLCTQAQFEWRLVFMRMVEAIRDYNNEGDPADDWQFDLLARQFRPVCYALGKCPWQASFDRGCTIRERVTKLGVEGGRVPSDKWHDPPIFQNLAIRPEEWLLDPTAGWVR